MEMLYFRGLFAVAFGLAISSNAFAVCSLPSITSAPQPLTVEIGCRAIFEVSATGAGPLTYQWFASGVPILGATNTVYTNERVRLIDDGLAYVVVVSNSCGGFASAPAVLTVLLGLLPPQLTGAAPGPLLDQIVLGFQTGCGGLAPVSAEAPANYMLTGGLVVTNAQLACSGTNVILTLSTRATEGANYTVTVTGVGDLSGNVIAPGSQATFRAGALLRHALRREHLWNFNGGWEAAAAESRWTACPDEMGWRTSFEAPRHIGARYAQRLSGMLLPAISTNYTFVLAANNQAALYLSSDEASANKRLIASSATPIPPRVWSCDGPATCSNRSTPIALEAGKRYYVEALMTEGSGEDHLAVAWTWPGGPALRDGHDPIQGTYLAAYGPSGGQIVISQQPQNATCIADGQATFSILAGVAPNSLLLTYQWQRNSVDIPGANSATYVTPRLTLTDNGTVYRCFVRAPGVSRTSANAFLTVSSGDPSAPTLLGAASVGPTRLLVLFSEPVSFPAPNSFIVDDSPAVEARLTDAGDSTVVEVIVSPGFLPGTRHSLWVRNVMDATGNALPSSTAVFVSQPALAPEASFVRGIPAGPKIVLEWSQGVLQASQGMEGPWSDLPDALSPTVVELKSSPCTAPSLGNYFRLRVGPQGE